MFSAGNTTNLRQLTIACKVILLRTFYAHEFPFEILYDHMKPKKKIILTKNCHLFVGETQIRPKKSNPKITLKYLLFTFD